MDEIESTIQKYWASGNEILDKAKQSLLRFCFPQTKSFQMIDWITPNNYLYIKSKCIFQLLFITDHFVFLQVNINGKQIIDIINKNPRVFNNVKYYVSSPWYDAAKAEIKNVKEVDFPPKGKRTIINGVSDIHYIYTVSYTHLTLPTIYSV